MHQQPSFLPGFSLSPLNSRVKRIKDQRNAQVGGGSKNIVAYKQKVKTYYYKRHITPAVNSGADVFRSCVVSCHVFLFLHWYNEVPFCYSVQC